MYLEKRINFNVDYSEKKGGMNLKKKKALKDVNSILDSASELDLFWYTWTYLVSKSQNFIVPKLFLKFL